MPCSKNDALRLLRKLVVAKVLTEETYRQDNQYGGVLSYLAVSEPAARALTQGTMTIKMPFAVIEQSHMPAHSVRGSCMAPYCLIPPECSTRACLYGVLR